MGELPRATEQTLTYGIFVSRLRTEAQRIARLTPGAIWYIFGSASRTFDSAKDVDVLVLCTNDRVADIVRRELQKLCRELPIHLLILTEEEEAELGFIQAEHCSRAFTE